MYVYTRIGLTRITCIFWFGYIWAVLYLWKLFSSVYQIHTQFPITRFQGTGPNIHCFNRGFTHTADQKMLLVKKYFISVTILTKMFWSCKSYKIITFNSFHIIWGVFHQKDKPVRLITLIIFRKQSYKSMHADIIAHYK